MVRKYLSIALLGATAVTVTSCNAKDAGYKKTAGGLEYNIVKDSPGIKKPAIGDHMDIHIKYFVPFEKGDSVLFDSRTMNENQPVPYRVTPPAFKGDLPEGLMMLTKGDSATFRLPLDTLLNAGMPLQPWMQKGKGQKVVFAVKVVDVKTTAELEAEQKANAAKQIGVDEKLITDYLAQNGIKATRTASGLYYKVDKMGTGAAPKSGNSVTMNYTGMTMDGKKFDSNVDPTFQHVEPFEFKLGVGQVIPGWDEGIALLPKGSKGTLYIPSPLAYGAQGRPPMIPQNAVLIFDVEVVDFK